MYRNLIWDLDGTLFDTYPAIVGAYQAAVRELGCEADGDWLMMLAKKSLSYCSTTLAATFQLDPASIDHAFGMHYARVTPEQQPPLPGVIELCRHVCNLGGRNVIVTHRGRVSSLALPTAHRMTGYFAGTITSDDGYPRKPDPTSMNAALALFKLDPSETLAVGDREIDVAAGKAAGLDSCLYSASMEDTAANYQVRDYGELYRYLAATP